MFIKRNFRKNFPFNYTYDVKGGLNLGPEARCRQGAHVCTPTPVGYIREKFLLRGRHGDWHPLRDPG